MKKIWVLLFLAFPGLLFAGESLHLVCNEDWQGSPDGVSVTLVDQTIASSGEVFEVRSLQSSERHYKFHFEKVPTKVEGRSQWMMTIQTWTGEDCFNQVFSSLEKTFLFQDKHGFSDMIFNVGSNEGPMDGDALISGSICGFGFGNLTLLELSCKLDIVPNETTQIERGSTE